PEQARGLGPELLRDEGLGGGRDRPSEGGKQEEGCRRQSAWARRRRGRGGRPVSPQRGGQAGGGAPPTERIGAGPARSRRRGSRGSGRGSYGPPAHAGRPATQKRGHGK